jgi:hypothetical protein
MENVENEKVLQQEVAECDQAYVLPHSVGVYLVSMTVNELLHILQPVLFSTTSRSSYTLQVQTVSLQATPLDLTQAQRYCTRTTMTLASENGSEKL